MARLAASHHLAAVWRRRNAIALVSAPACTDMQQFYNASTSPPSLPSARRFCSPYACDRRVTAAESDVSPNRGSARKRYQEALERLATRRATLAWRSPALAAGLETRLQVAAEALVQNPGWFFYSIDHPEMRDFARAAGFRRLADESRVDLMAYGRTPWS